MVYSLLYRRPPHVTASSDASLSGMEKAKSIGGTTMNSQTSNLSLGIPDALSFDRIITGGTCPVRSFTSTYHHQCLSSHLELS